MKTCRNIPKVDAGSVILQGITMAACEYSKIRKTRKSILRNLEVSPVNCLRNWKNLRTPKTVPPFNPFPFLWWLELITYKFCHKQQRPTPPIRCTGKNMLVGFNFCVYSGTKRSHEKWMAQKSSKIQILYFFFGDVCSLISTPVVSIFQDINHRFPALGFISDRISFPRLFFSKRRFFPVSKTLSCRDIK